jgi:hypothetical protein
MATWIQNLVAILIVAACGVWAVWQSVKSLRGKPGKLGSCCAKGCSAQSPTAEPKVQFIPSEMLTRRTPK